METRARKRVRSIIERFEEIQIDAMLVTDIKNIRYLTNFSGSSGFLLLTGERAVFVTDFRYKTQAEEEVSGFELKIEKEKMHDVISELVKDYGLKTVGFEAESLAFDIYSRIAEKLSGAELKPTRSLIEDLRMIKDDEEISSIKKSIAMAEDAFTCIVEGMKPGVKEKDIAISLEYELRRKGSGPVPFDIIVASGERAALPHASSSDKPLEKGDMVIIDWGAQADGYNSDISRTFIIGSNQFSSFSMNEAIEGFSDKRKIYEIVLEAQNEAIKEIKPGITFSDLDAVARDFINDAGHGEYFGHSLGHGVGLSVHEAPHISWQGEGVIQKGMVFTIEPGIYIPGLGGVRIEDMVLVKEDRAEVLTHLPRDLIIW